MSLIFSSSPFSYIADGVIICKTTPPHTECLEEEREIAALSLVSLASAAGRAKDLLLLVKMLLRVGYGKSHRLHDPSSPPTSPASSKGSHGSMNSNNLDELLAVSSSNKAGTAFGPTGAGSRSSSAANSVRR